MSGDVTGSFSRLRSAGASERECMCVRVCVCLCQRISQHEEREDAAAARADCQQTESSSSSSSSRAVSRDHRSTFLQGTGEDTMRVCVCVCVCVCVSCKPSSAVAASRRSGERTGPDPSCRTAAQTARARWRLLCVRARVTCACFTEWKKCSNYVLK